MSQNMVLFGKRYRRFLRVFERLASLCPPGAYPRLLFLIGRWLNPYQERKPEIVRAFRSALPDRLTEKLWLDWLDSHIRFVLDFFSYKALGTDWVKRNVVVSSPELLDELRSTGGLLLGYHTHHQNTLGCVLGLHGIPTWFIAAPPRISPLYPFVGAWDLRVNAESAKHFGGGGYLFTDDIPRLLEDTGNILDGHGVIECLCDFNRARPRAQSGVALFDRQISPPTKIIELAVARGAPVFVAMFAPDAEKLSLKMVRLDTTSGINAIIADYIAFLESNIRATPSCWQGWDWFNDLPLADRAPTDDTHQDKPCTARSVEWR